MKKIFLLATTLLWAMLCFSQNVPNYSSIKLETKEDYNQAANDAAHQAANYILSTPVDKHNMNRLQSIVYLLKWMTGSPDYSFAIDEEITKLAKKNDDLMAVYMAAMAKYVLENKTESTNANKVKLNAVKLVVDFSKDTRNNVKQTSELKKLIEADNNGKLAEYLKIQ